MSMRCLILSYMCSYVYIFSRLYSTPNLQQAELAVDVTFPGDETAVESVQQFGGNLCSAMLVPVAGRAAKLDYQLTFIGE